MSLVGRLLVILFALFIAVLIAGIALAVGVMVPDFVTVTTDPIEHFQFIAFSFLATNIVMAAAFVPALVLVGLAETFDIRSVFYYAFGGGAVALIAFFGSDIRFEETTDMPPVAFGLQLVVAAGIIAGFVYWIIAGRNAGRWKNSGGSVRF